jgi:HSP20 family protein
MYPGTATRKNITPKDTKAIVFKSPEYSTPGTVQLIPSSNIEETPGQYLIVMAAPGLHQEDFSIQIDDCILSISAKKEVVNNSPNDRWEYDFSEWTRNFVLPGDADAMLAHAKYWNGELIIRIPRGNTLLNKTRATVYVY